MIGNFRFTLAAAAAAAHCAWRARSCDYVRVRQPRTQALAQAQMLRCRHERNPTDAHQVLWQCSQHRCSGSAAAAAAV
eukprot:12139768-Alexandrium_andersonii.AAC.1